ncbi:MAG: hypothetical protein UU11_C0004G0027 [Parcubacteria group bacterium GW2011_GWF2_40_69]|nr:MAG: hypothetical protein UT25_C0001G0027 [Parcubacteria group bacterium GW2011_GWC1_39_12]KKR19551.1 MAG: hypothetical protein UT49_C0001G0027 [Parcubacteria group bacterium GW2011_GWF1_39_37]KKR35704.1 MAG: hypothetical protein UT68_C0001G0027 [Parcubacteria group bacterium GW2011_GWC2_40_10]KKR68967.1 MAG: hypothetical protein UU11_C0004G0027 [Parcubacteria group bacterium GW2011_GWF2_40_69]KKR81786.1 MAG: hypothetical protein UU27_C0008G0027 [Parcubacteria group bacterium GW2011_GWD1_40_
MIEFWNENYVAILVAIIVLVIVGKSSLPSRVRSATGQLRLPDLSKSGRWLKPLAGVALCHFTFWCFWPEVWKALFFTKWSLLAHPLIAVAFLFYREDGKKGEKKMNFLGRVMLTILIVGLGFMVGRTVLAKGVNLVEIPGHVGAAWKNFWSPESATRAVKWCEQNADGTYTVTAPVGRPSCRVDLTKGSMIEPEGLITIWDHRGKPYKDGPGKETNSNLPWMDWGEFQSRVSWPVTVKVTVGK